MGICIVGSKMVFIFNATLSLSHWRCSIFHVFEWRRSMEEGERPYILPFLFRGVTRMYHTYMYIPLSKEQGELSNHSLLRGVRGSDSALFAGQTICIRVWSNSVLSCRWRRNNYISLLLVDFNVIFHVFELIFLLVLFPSIPIKKRNLEILIKH